MSSTSGFDFASQQPTFNYTPEQQFGYPPQPIEQQQFGYPQQQVVEQQQFDYPPQQQPVEQQPTEPNHQPFSSTATEFFGLPATATTTTEIVPEVPAVPEVLKFHLGELGKINGSIVNYSDDHPELKESNHILEPKALIFKELGAQKGQGYDIRYVGFSVNYNSTIYRRSGQMPSTATVGRFVYEPTPYGLTNFEHYRNHAVPARIIKIVSKLDPEKPQLKPRTTYFLVIELTPESQIRADIIGLYRTLVIANSDEKTSKILHTKTSLESAYDFNKSFSYAGNVSASGGITDPLVYKKSEGKNVDKTKKGYPSLWIPLNYETNNDGSLKKSTVISTFDEDIKFKCPADWALISSCDFMAIPSITISCVVGDTKDAKLRLAVDSCIAFNFTQRQGSDSQADVKARVAASGEKDETLELLRALRTAQSDSEKSELNFLNVKKKDTAATTTTAQPQVSTAVATQQIPQQQMYYPQGFVPQQPPQGFVPQMGQSQPQGFVPQMGQPQGFIPQMGQQQPYIQQQQAYVAPPQQQFGQPQA